MNAPVDPTTPHPTFDEVFTGNFGMEPDEALLIAHAITEYAVDIRLGGEVDPSLGRKLARAARGETKRFADLLVAAFAADYAAYCFDGDTATAASVLVAAEKKHREDMIYLGRAISQPEPVAVQLMAGQLVAILPDFLGTPLPANTQAIMEAGISTAMVLCDDYRPEIEATIKFVADNLRDHWIVYEYQGKKGPSDSCKALERWVASDLCSSFDPQALADQLRSEDTQWPDIPTSITSDVALTDDDKAFLKLAVEAYVWGYAPMTIYRLEQQKTNSQAPLNHFYHPTHLAHWQLPSPVSAPNMDVLYSSAFLDLSQGPFVFTIPSVEGYYVIQLDDAYGNSQASLGSRTQPGGAAEEYLIVGPSDPGYTDPVSYLGQGFDQQHVLPVDTEHAWLIVRIPVNPYAEPGSPISLTQSDSYQANAAFDLTPLSNPQPVPPMDPAVAKEFEAPPSDAMTFFTWLGMAVKNSPLPMQAAFSNAVLPPYLMSPSPSVSDAQQALLDSFQPLGLDASGFHPEVLDCRQRALLEAGMVIGDCILKAGQNFITVGPPEQNYWHVIGTSNIGKYPNTPSGWSVRSVAAYEGGIASLAPDGTYPTTTHDINRARIRGGRAYTITFDAHSLPPVSEGGFWSLTIYSDDSASGVQTNLPAVSSAAVLNTAYSQPPVDATSVVDTTHFYNPDYQEDDTIYFAVSGGGIDAERPYFVIDVRCGVFQLSRGPWTPDHSGMAAITVDPSLVGKTLMTGLVIPVHSLGSQQLPAAPPALRGTQLAFEKDGDGNSLLRLYLQNTPPALRSNWLPIPDGGTFQAMFRLYNPTPATEQSGEASVLSSTTIPLTTDDPDLAKQYPQEPVNDSNRYGTFVFPPIMPID